MNLGSADLKVSFGERKHELNVSTYQMCILLLFNETPGPLSYEEIQQSTGIPETDLQRSLQSLSLVKGRNVLVKHPMSKDVSPTDQFSFNENFQSKLYRVKIGTVTGQKEGDPERSETRRRIEEDRKPQIEASIVRIMKARRVLDHNNLVSEVTSQLSTRFLPTPQAIKKVRATRKKKHDVRSATNRRSSLVSSSLPESLSAYRGAFRALGSSISLSLSLEGGGGGT